MADFGARFINFQTLAGDYHERTRILSNATPATGGTFTITVNGQTATGLAHNITASAMQTALEALSNVAPGDVAVSMLSGSNLGSASAVMLLDWSGGALDNTDPTVTIDTSGLTGNPHTLEEHIRQTVSIPSGRGSASTVKAARYCLAGTGSLDTIADDAGIGFGVTDGTTSLAVATQAEDNVVAASADTAWATSASSVMLAINLACTDIRARAVHVSFGTGSATFDWVMKPPNQLRGNVWLWYGDVEAKVANVVGNSSLNGTTSVNPGFTYTPRLVEAFTVSQTISDGGFGAEASIVIGACDEGLSQGCMGACAEDNEANTSSGLVNGNAVIAIGLRSVGKSITTGAGLEVTSMSSSSVVFTTRLDAASLSAAVLILGWADYGAETTWAHSEVYLFSDVSGVETLDAINWPPQAAMLASQRAATLNVTSNSQGQISVGGIDETSQGCVCWTARDNRTTSETTTFVSNSVLVDVVDISSPHDWIADGALVPLGIDLDVTDAAGGDRVVTYWAVRLIVQGSASLDAAAPDITASGSVIISGSSALAAAAPDISATGNHANETTGTAALDAAAPVLASSGTLLIAGSAALAAAAPDLTASGALTVTGTAALASAAPDITASGQVISVTGSAALAAAAPDLTASGALTITGTAALASAAPDLATAGALTITGTAALLVAAPDLTASGQVVSVTGSAALAAAAPDLTASGTLLIAGSAALAAAAPDLTASGALTITGTAALASAAPDLSATGQSLEEISGPAALDAAAPALASSGTLLIAGSAALAAAAPALAASGALTITGTAALASAAPDITASGQVISVTGSAALAAAAPDLTASGTAVVTITGTAALVAAAPDFSATGTAALTIDGTAALDAAAPALAASGTLLIAGSVALAAAAPDLTASGALTITGTAAILAAAPALAASGTLAITGTSALAVAAPDFSATDAPQLFDLVVLEAGRRTVSALDAGTRLAAALDAGRRTVYDLEASN